MHQSGRNNVPLIANERDTITSFFYYFKHSSNIVAAFKVMQCVLECPMLIIKKMCDVSWFPVYDALKAVYEI